MSIEYRRGDRVWVTPFKNWDEIREGKIVDTTTDGRYIIDWSNTAPRRVFEHGEILGLVTR